MGRPKLSDGRTVSLSLLIPEALDVALREFAAESGVKRSEAAREWLIRGSGAAAETRGSRRHVTNDRPGLPEPKGSRKPAASAPARRCACSRPRPAVTGYGLCTGCKLPR